MKTTITTGAGFATLLLGGCAGLGDVVAPPQLTGGGGAGAVETPLWFYRDVAHAEQGPFTATAMQQWIAHGMLPLNTPVRHLSEGAGRYRPLSEVPLLVGAGAPRGGVMTLQAHVTNLGLHFGLEKHATLADAYCQSFRLDARGTASGPPVPLVARVPEYALAHRRRSVDAPLRIPLEVNTTAAFEAAGIGHLLPALCTRSDAAHSFSAWAVGLRWCTEPRLPSGTLDAASIDGMGSLASPSAGDSQGAGQAAPKPASSAVANAQDRAAARLARRFSEAPFRRSETAAASASALALRRGATPLGRHSSNQSGTGC
jgi:hypothetical protein